MATYEQVNSATYRDEEVEKLIKRMFEFALFKVYAGGEMHGPEAEAYIRSMLRDVEILSARRAREKAIEECLAEVPTQTKEQMKEINEGNNDFKRGFYTAFQDIHAYIALLKTK